MPAVVIHSLEPERARVPDRAGAPAIGLTIAHDAEHDGGSPRAHICSMLRRMLRTSAVAGLVTSCGSAPPIVPSSPSPSVLGIEGARVVDLSYAFDDETIVWPTEDGFTLEKELDGITPGGFYYAANRFKAPEHGGTHIDAPVHFAKGKATVDELPLRRLMGPAVVVDVTAQCAKDRDYRITTGDLEAWEAAHGVIPDGAIVLLRTGFGRFWPDREKYMGTAERGAEAVKKLHFPGLHPAAAVWLTSARGIHAVGLDTPSIDHGPSTTFDTHRALFARGVPAFENLANLELLPATGATVIALPMKIKGGSGGPLRAVAIIPPPR